VPRLRAHVLPATASFPSAHLASDKAWDAPATVGSYIWMVISMGFLYWTSPYLLITQKNELPAWLLGLNISMFTTGMLLHHGADIQKHFTLKLKRGLITDGFFKHCRNPNYLGEIFIYSAFALMSCQSPHWYLPWCYTGFIWVDLFLPNWVRKDRSISRHPGWAQYKARSGLVLPWGWWKNQADAGADAATGPGGHGAAAAGGKTD
jgi:steroid 5-alpha reductase family enzyme